MKVTCQIITTPSSDTAGTLILLHLDARRYLFGHLAEGAQRALLQRKIRTGKLTDFFLTGKTDWKNYGGLLGMILTLADQEAAKQADHAQKAKEATERNLEFLKAAKQEGAARAKALLGSAPTIPGPLEKKALHIHGGDNLMHTLGTTRAFVFRTTMAVNINEMKHDFSDEFLNVRPMKIYPEDYQEPPGSPGTQEITGLTLQGRKRSYEEFKAPRSREEILRSVVSDMFNSSWTMDTLIDEPTDAGSADANSTAPPASPTKQRRGSPSAPPAVSETKRVRAPWPASAVKSLPHTKPSVAALSYYITMHRQRGRFLPDVAKSLGVRPGPDFRKLTEGYSVSTECGRLVTPEQCMEPAKPGKRVVVLDIPDLSYIAPTLSRPELEDQSEASVFWILGRGVASDERVLGKIRNWSEGHHIVSSPELCPNEITFQGAAKAATRLHLLHEDHFPIPFSESTSHLSLAQRIPAIIAKPQQLLEINPNFQVLQLPIDMVINGSFDFKGVQGDTDPEFVKLCRSINEQVKNDDSQLSDHLNDLPGKDVEIITLGTGSAQPSKYRNVSATLVRLPNVGSILFDCGEGTIGQLSRLYGPQKLQEVLKDLKCIYISHLHADHHLGTAAVLRAWYEAKHNCIPASQNERNVHMAEAATTPEGVLSKFQGESVPMWIVALGKYNTWLREYADVEDFGYSRIRLIATEEIIAGEGSSLLHLPGLSKALNLKHLQVAKAVHCLGATTCAFTFGAPYDKFKFAYSGDTRPTKEFVEIGQDATVLLHEATFDDELIGEAMAKKHSTTSEALTAGLQMRAKRVILTHFSQRYPKLPILSGETGGTDMKIALAFDMMRMKVGEIARFERFIPALRELYKDVDDEGVEVSEIMETPAPSNAEKEKDKKEKRGKKEKEKKEKGNSRQEGKERMPLPSDSNRPLKKMTARVPAAILPKAEGITMENGQAMSEQL